MWTNISSIHTFYLFFLILQASTVCSTTATVGGTTAAQLQTVQTTKGLQQQQQQQQGTTTAGNIRMGGINLTNIGGKPVLLASKPQSLQAQVYTTILFIYYKVKLCLFYFILHPFSNLCWKLVLIRLLRVTKLFFWRIYSYGCIRCVKRYISFV